MCGIGGIITKSTCANLECVPRMMERLRHRGPDDFGYAAYSKGEVHLGRDGVGCVINPEVVLFYRRLSILDLSETGWQPMGTSDERYFIVYNGEIYNYVELRAELEDLGYRFKSRSDTEVLLLAYSCWGLEAFTRFTGMFALAILDTQERKLILARDCFGIKPLYYTWGSERFVFDRHGHAPPGNEAGFACLQLRCP